MMVQAAQHLLLGRCRSLSEEGPRSALASDAVDLQVALALGKADDLLIKRQARIHGGQDGPH